MVKAYTCGVAYQHELGHTNITIWSSIEALKAATDCWEECGIVEIEVLDKVNWVEPQTL